MRGGSQHAFWVTLGAGVVGCGLIKKGGVLAPECGGLTDIAYIRHSVTPVTCKQHQDPLPKVLLLLNTQHIQGAVPKAKV